MRLPFVRPWQGAFPGSGSSLTLTANARGNGRISNQRSRVACYVIPTDEELMIARHTLRVLRTQPAFQLKEKSA